MAYLSNDEIVKTIEGILETSPLHYDNSEEVTYCYGLLRGSLITLVNLLKKDEEE